MSPGQTANTLEQRLAEAKARANLLEALYAHATHDQEQLRQALEQSKREKEAMRREFEAMIEDQERRHDAVLNSTSWRVTAPLRSLVNLIKRSPHASP